MTSNFTILWQERCALYWPIPEEPSLVGGNVAVSMRGEAGSSSLRVREFLLQKVRHACSHLCKYTLT